MPILFGATLTPAHWLPNALAQGYSPLWEPSTPLQLGCGAPRGCKAAVHAACLYIHNMTPGHVLLKWDLKNVFNCLRCDKMLMVVQESTLECFLFLLYIHNHPPSFMETRSFNRLKECSRDTHWAPCCSA